VEVIRADGEHDSSPSKKSNGEVFGRVTSEVSFRGGVGRCGATSLRSTGSVCSKVSSLAWGKD